MDNYERYIGQILDGRYRIDKLIGLGGMAAVFRAFDMKYSRVVAIKMLRDDMAKEEENVKRFINESKTVAMLSHPNIVKIFAVSVREDIKYIVMEYVEGITLKTLMQKKKILSPAETLNYAKQILTALAHAHSKHIVHRDIKPQNIMLLKNGQIKVTDFGIAKLPNAETLTMTDKAIGTVYYISPEQASGQQIDARSDLYSLACTMYEMSTGELPFDAESPVSVALMHVNDKVPLPSSINPDIPAGLENIIMNTLEKNPEERYQSAEEMLADVNKLIANPKTRFKNRHKKEDEESFRGAIKKLFNGSSMLPVILGVTVPFVIILAVCGVVLFNSIINSNSTEKTIKVDDFVGKIYDIELATALDKSEYYNAEIKYDYTSEEEEGMILSQTPKAGSKRKVDIGKTKCDLVLTVSKKNAAIDVPNIIAVEYRSAELKLKSLGIKYVKEEIADDAFEVGQVVKTSPAFGEKLEDGQTLTVYVSSGPATGDVEVPDVKGMTEAEAAVALKEKGLYLEGTEKVKSSDEEGTVVEQSLEAGTSVPRNTRITLKISGGENYSADGEDETTEAVTEKKDKTEKVTEAETTTGKVTEAVTTKAPETKKETTAETTADTTTAEETTEAQTEKEPVEPSEQNDGEEVPA